MGILKVWGNDDVGPWEETVECNSQDVNAWLEHYKEGLEGHRFNPLECPRCSENMLVDDGMAYCPNKECCHAEPLQELS